MEIILIKKVYHFLSILINFIQKKNNNIYKMSVRTYLIIGVTDVGSIDFETVCESENTLRYSLDSSKFIVKYEGTIPQCFITSGIDYGATYTHNQIITEIGTSGNGWYTDPD